MFGEEIRVVLDLGDVEYVSGFGVSVLLKQQEIAMKHGGSIALVNVQPRVMEVLELAGLDTIFEIHNGDENTTSEENVAAALNSFKKD